MRDIKRWPCGCDVYRHETGAISIRLCEAHVELALLIESALEGEE